MRQNSAVVGGIFTGLAPAASALCFIFVGLVAQAADMDIKTATASCMECHGQQGNEAVFKDGSKRSVFVDPKAWMSSIHGGQLTCTDCHRDITGYPHPKAKMLYNDARDFTLAQANTCQRCHYAYYTRVLDSTHYELLKAGERSAPTCVDCHGSHAIRDPKTPRTEVTTKCARCHTEIFQAYAKSIHGRALIEEGNADVPVCTDCHGSHAITDPAAIKLHGHDICGKCHSDVVKMAKYKLNPDVVSTYLDDFHGASNRLYAERAGKAGKSIASCSDCHGIHDIQSLKTLKAGQSKEQVRERVAQTCRHCHNNADVKFADAWLSHYPPSIERAPLVWIVKIAYRILIPLIMTGLVLHILLHLWRLKTRR